MTLITEQVLVLFNPFYVNEQPLEAERILRVCVFVWLMQRFEWIIYIYLKLNEYVSSWPIHFRIKIIGILTIVIKRNFLFIIWIRAISST